MSNSVRADRLLLGSLLALFLSACGGGGDAPPQANAPAPPSAPATPAVAAQTPAEKPENTGLTPLPTPNDVLAAVKIGRDDPFAALPPPGISGTSQVRLSLPDAFRFTGVIRSAGTSQAIVEYGGTSGALSVGDRGGRSTDLLPSGWTVAGINVDRGQLTLRQGKQTVSAEL
ncbi:hypothetical protein [Cyanobium sp. PCC 7001]|uniref:hypothetical protein n=1 Tax=Cyanobium sp. PCC 7001 TaxID=180281 RepID=UPI0012EA3A1C|nr:hypothetical protein [Cyanobium sp. PCC 7001]